MSWIAQSNRWKHLLCGFIIALIAGTAWAGFYAALAAGLACEYKDRSWGGKWDWLDVLCTAVGGALGAGVWLLISAI